MAGAVRGEDDVGMGFAKWLTMTSEKERTNMDIDENGPQPVSGNVVGMAKKAVKVTSTFVLSVLLFVLGWIILSFYAVYFAFRGFGQVTLRPLHRIGYEVFGEAEPTAVLAKDQPGGIVELMTDFLTSNMVDLVIILPMLGFVLVLVLLIAKGDMVKKMMCTVKLKCANGWHGMINQCVFFVLAVGVLCLLPECGLLGEDWSLVMYFIGLIGAVFAVACKVLIVLIRACLHRRIFWRSWAAGMLFFLLSGCIFAYESYVEGQSWWRRKVIEKRIYVDYPGWKYSQEVAGVERESINAKIAAVKDELQARFDLEYEKLKSVEELWKIELPQGAHVSSRYRQNLIERNCLKVVSSILEQDKQLCVRCLGVPIEWLAEAMKCPEPSYRSD